MAWGIFGGKKGSKEEKFTSKGYKPQNYEGSRIDRTERASSSKEYRDNTHILNRLMSEFYTISYHSPLKDKGTYWAQEAKVIDDSALWDYDAAYSILNKSDHDSLNSAVCSAESQFYSIITNTMDESDIESAIDCLKGLVEEVLSLVESSGKGDGEFAEKLRNILDNEPS
jgi:hypothetical protein